MKETIRKGTFKIADMIKKKAVKKQGHIFSNGEIKLAISRDANNPDRLKCTELSTGSGVVDCQKGTTRDEVLIQSLFFYYSPNLKPEIRRAKRELKKAGIKFPLNKI